MPADPPYAVAVLADGTAVVAQGPPGAVAVRPLTDLSDLPAGRAVWWRAATTAPLLVRAGVRPVACWDLGAVHRLLHGARRDDPAAVFSPGEDVAEPGQPTAGHDAAGPGGRRGPGPAGRRALPGLGRRAVDAARRAGRPRAGRPLGGARPARSRPGRRRRWRSCPTRAWPRSRPPLALLTAYAETAAALLAVELGQDGLPVDRATAGRSC